MISSFDSEPATRRRLLIRALYLALLIITSSITPSAHAKQTTSPLTFAGKITHLHNDALLFEGRDRWRTGGVASSFFLEGSERFYEIRGRLEIITPWNSRQAGDRPATGVYGFGIFVHDEIAGAKLTYGLEALRTSVDLLDFQEAIHQVGGYDGYWHSKRQEKTTKERSFLSVSGEVAREFEIMDFITARPYASAEFGYDNHARFGIEAVVGASGFPVMATRDVVTGFSMPANLPRNKRVPGSLGMQLHLGADMSFGHTDNLLAGSDVEPTHFRTRLRVGGQVTYKRFKLFYGVTRLSKEFVGQREAQTVGTLSFLLGF